MNETTLASLLDPSLFISDDVHEKQVTLPDGRKHGFFIRELQAADFHVFAIAQHDQSAEKQADAWARLIAKAVATPDGKPALSLDQARKLKFPVQVGLVNAIREVNSYQGKESSPVEEAQSGSDTSSP